MFKRTVIKDSANQPVDIAQDESNVYMFCSEVPIVGSYALTTLFRALDQKLLEKFGIADARTLRALIAPDRFINALKFLNNHVQKDSFDDHFEEATNDVLDPILLACDWRACCYCIGDGYVYSKASLTGMLAAVSPKSPLTRMPIEPTHIWHHPMLRAIQQHFATADTLDLDQLFRLHSMTSLKPYKNETAERITAERIHHRPIHILRRSFSYFLLLMVFGARAFVPDTPRVILTQNGMPLTLMKTTIGFVRCFLFPLIAVNEFRSYILENSSISNLLVDTIFGTIYINSVSPFQLDIRQDIPHFFRFVLFPVLQARVGYGLLCNNRYLTNPFRQSNLWPMIAASGLCLINFANHSNEDGLGIALTQTASEAPWIYLFFHYVIGQLTNHPNYIEQLNEFILPLLILATLYYDAEENYLVSLTALVSSLLHLFSSPITDYFNHNEMEDTSNHRSPQRVYSIFQPPESDAALRLETLPDFEI